MEINEKFDLQNTGSRKSKRTDRGLWMTRSTN